MSTAPTSHHIPRRYRVPAAVDRRRLRSDGSTRGVAEAGRALLLVAGCLVVLGTGCSRDSGASSFYSPTWTPPATTTATASATPTLSPEQAAARATALAMEPPQPEDDMNDNSPLGATKAATYFLNLYPYVYATGDLNTFKTLSEDNCEFCNNVISNVTDRHNVGGWVDPWEQEITPLEYWTDENDPNRYVIRTQVVSQEHTAHSEDGAATEIAASDGVLLIQVHWGGNDWHIEEIALEEDEAK